MSNSPKLHINRKYHPPIDSVISVTQKRWGSVWVKFFDEKSKRNIIAIAKTDMGNILTVINTYKLMRGDRQLLGIKEQ